MKKELERIALCAEVANHWTDDMRLMPAAGVADTIYQALDHIVALEELLDAAVRDAKEAEAYVEELEKRRAIILQERDEAVERLIKQQGKEQ